MKIPKFLKKKRTIWITVIVVIVLVIGYFIFRGGGVPGTIQTGSVSRQNLEQTVLATGQVVSGTDLNLGFKDSGIVRKVLVTEGDKVFQGQLLAYIDQTSALASLTSAKGSLAQAQASYDKLVAGATTENIQTYRDSITSANQDLVNTYNTAINYINSARTAIYNSFYIANTIKNTYFYSVDQQTIQVTDAKDDISIQLKGMESHLYTAESSMSGSDIDIAVSKTIFALNKVYSDLNIIRAQCDQGPYYEAVSSTDKTSLDTQKTNINTALTNITTSQQNIASYKIALQQAENQLALIKAPPTQAEIDLALAQILSAQGQVDSAQASLNNLVIRAPISGTITHVDIKTGEQASAMQGVIVLQDISSLHTEADISEANVAYLEIGQLINYTFDALGPDQRFEGEILSINPASTVISGVVNYKVKGNLPEISKIKPGMTANMTILVDQKENVIAVPATAVVNKDDKKYVRVIDDIKDGSYHEVEVQTGLEADGGVVEILSGLKDGQKIIIYMKS